ncbi:MAG: SRPBCC family protein [Muribaculaceae bacterium]|nr:SRPBCC family protein [Muribaculaceae bacterium]
MTYKSSGRLIAAPAQAVFDKLSNLEGLKNIIANIPDSAVPDDKRELLDGVKVTADSISFPAGPVGEITLQVCERVAPTLIRLEGVGTPVALSMSLEIAILSEASCEACVAIDIDIPKMMAPMIGGTIQKMADQFADVLEKLNYD